MTFLVIRSVVGGESEDPNWTQIVAAEASELEARKHLTDDFVEWPTDEQSVAELDSWLGFNPAIMIRIERWVSTHGELVCSMISQDALDEACSV